MAGQESAPLASRAGVTKQGGTLFARAQAYAPLTPGERALLRLIEGLACAAVVAALPVVADALGHGPVRWDDVARTALAAAAVAVLLALAKYARAQGDPTLGTAIAEVAGALAQPHGALGGMPMSGTNGVVGVAPATAHVTVSTAVDAGEGTAG